MPPVASINSERDRNGTFVMLHFCFKGLTVGALAIAASAFGASAQDRLPWERTQPAAPRYEDEDSRPLPPPAPYQGSDYGRPGPAPSPYGSSRGNPDAYRPPASANNGYSSGDVYRPPSSGPYREPAPAGPQPYDRNYGDDAGPQPPYAEPRREYGRPVSGYYTKNEIAEAGHGFFGSVSRGLASVIEYTWQKAGRPNGYILGEDAGGAFVAGLRYGEGRLHTKDAGTHKVYWQGPSIGYDVGGEGSKTMVLVYNLRDPADIYHRFGGVQGTAYLIGGVSVQFQKYGDVILAPIRSGVGLRIGANVGYLKYTRSPTWNPF
jgi:hypothetical protein